MGFIVDTAYSTVALFDPILLPDDVPTPRPLGALCGLRLLAALRPASPARQKCLAGP